MSKYHGQPLIILWRDVFELKTETLRCLCAFREVIESLSVFLSQTQSPTLCSPLRLINTVLSLCICLSQTNRTGTLRAASQQCLRQQHSCLHSGFPNCDHMKEKIQPRRPMFMFS